MKSYYVRHRSHNKGGILLALVMLVSLGAAIYTGFNNGLPPDNTDDFVNIPETISTEEFLEVPAKYDFNLCYFYSQMDDFDKYVYVTFYDMIMHKDNQDYSRVISIPVSEYSARADDLYLIYFAMIEDNPELFYLDISEEPRVVLEGLISGDNATIYFSLNPGIENENYMIGALEYATNRFMEDIDLSVSDAEIELQIHDKLIDLVSYDHSVYESAAGRGLAYTAYGALVDDGEGRNNSVVCEGYANAFQYLLKRAGIMSVQITGIGGSVVNGVSDEGLHAWNAVLLDGEWYEVDCTWDDPDFDERDLDEETVALLQSEEAYFASTHYWYNRTTEEMSHLPDALDYVLEYQVEGGIAQLCRCHEGYHIREIYSDKYSSTLFDYLNDMLPEASGTAYGLGL